MPSDVRKVVGGGCELSVSFHRHTSAPFVGKAGGWFNGKLMAQPPERTRIASGSRYENAFGFVRAMRVGDRVVVAGTAPIWPDGACPEDPEIQAARCLEIIADALSRAGARLDDVVRTRMFITDVGDADAVGRAHGRLFSGMPPAATMVVVAGLLDPRWKVEIEAEAVLGRPPGPA